jgi:L-threonylcarbamoyladenylate synthase
VTGPALERAHAALEAGLVVAAATETFFGLLADATRADAVERLLALKPRGSEKGMPLILPDRAAWPALVRELPQVAVRLADRFWPGPLTIALPAAAGVDERLLNDGSLAVRLPASSPAARLAADFGRPLTATSANQPGRPPAERPEQVREAFAEAAERGELVIVESQAPGGRPSTVVVIESGAPRIVRAGAIDAADIERALAG